MHTRGKFREHERSVSVARGAANCFVTLLNKIYDEKAENLGEKREKNR